MDSYNYLDARFELGEKLGTTSGCLIALGADVDEVVDDLIDLIVAFKPTDLLVDRLMGLLTPARVRTHGKKISKDQVRSLSEHADVKLCVFKLYNLGVLPITNVSQFILTLIGILSRSHLVAA